MEINFNQVDYIYNEKTTLAKQALKDINLKFEEGKIYGIIGPSGSGKTTLIQLINALMLPSSGELRVGKYKLIRGVKINNINSLRFNVGLVFQLPEEQFFQSTVKKEIEFGMKYFRYKLGSIDRRVREALKMVDLNEEYLASNPFELSGGEKRKVAIASILAFNPKIVILDEPTIGLDYHGKKKLMMLAKRLRDRYHKTVIICTHDVDMLYQLADNVIALYEGEVIIQGKKEEVFNHISLLRKNHIRIPKIVEFTYKVNNQKGIKLGINKDVKDLIKDIYRNV